MATSKLVVAGSDVTASQLKDLMRQIEDESIKHSHLQAFLEHRNPFEVPALFLITDDGTKKTSELLAECRRQFEVYCYLPDEEMDKQFPAPAQPTTRRFQKVVEADEENKNKSADDLKQADQITLRERLIMEIQYFQETGRHLDIQNFTLCDGSRYSGGSVPSVDWDSDDRKVSVGCYHPDVAFDRLRARAVVS